MLLVDSKVAREALANCKIATLVSFVDSKVTESHWLVGNCTGGALAFLGSKKGPPSIG